MKTSFRIAALFAMGLSLFACKKPDQPKPQPEPEPVITLSFVKNNVAITADTYDLAADEIYVSPTLKIDPAGTAVTFESSNVAVATVDAQGKVTPVAVGTATITAKAGDKASASFTLTVSDSTPVRQERNLSFMSATVEKTTDDTPFDNPLIGNKEGGLSYSIDKTSVGTVDKYTGLVTIVGPGTAIITASAPETATLKAGTATFTLIVTLAPQDRHLVFAEASVSKSMGDPAFTNTLNGVTSGVTYSTSDSKVATVDASSGLVTIVGIGTATITASAPATSEYKAGTASFTLTVAQKEYPGVGIEDITDGGTITLT